MFFCLFCQFRQNLNFLRLWFNLYSKSRDDSKFSKFRFSHFLHKSSPLLKSTDYKVNLYKCPLAVVATVHRNYDCKNPFSDLSFLFWGGLLYTCRLTCLWLQWYIFWFSFPFQDKIYNCILAVGRSGELRRWLQNSILDPICSKIFQWDRKLFTLETKLKVEIQSIVNISFWTLNWNLFLAKGTNS